MKVIKEKFPQRRQFGKKARLAVVEVFDYYDKIGKDFGAGGKFTETYCRDFVRLLGNDPKGNCVAFNSGTVALFAAVRALNLPPDSEVLVSPVTDPGMISAVIMNNLRPRLVDFAPNEMFTGVEQLHSRLSPKTRAVLLNHLSGRPLPETLKIFNWARANKLYFIEDASQCHAGYVKFRGRKKMIGTISHISCFSTMFSKNHSSGGAGGLVYTVDSSLYRRVQLESDKGKPRWQNEFNEKNPETFSKAALNLGLNEISAAIGSATLKELPAVNRRRLKFLKMLRLQMKNLKLQTSLLSGGEGEAPYFAILEFNSPYLSCDKAKFTQALLDFGLPLNPDYKYLVNRWPWAQAALADDFIPQEANKFISRTFNLLFNENFGEREAKRIADAIAAVEAKYRRN